MTKNPQKPPRQARSLKERLEQARKVRLVDNVKVQMVPQKTFQAQWKAKTAQLVAYLQAYQSY